MTLEHSGLSWSVDKEGLKVYWNQVYSILPRKHFTHKHINIYLTYHTHHSSHEHLNHYSFIIQDQRPRQIWL